MSLKVVELTVQSRFHWWWLRFCHWPICIRSSLRYLIEARMGSTCLCWISGLVRRIWKVGHLHPNHFQALSIHLGSLRKAPWLRRKSCYRKGGWQRPRVSPRQFEDSNLQILQLKVMWMKSKLQWWLSKYLSCLLQMSQATTYVPISMPTQSSYHHFLALDQW